MGQDIPQLVCTIYSRSFFDPVHSKGGISHSLPKGCVNDNRRLNDEAIVRSLHAGRPLLPSQLALLHAKVSRTQFNGMKVKDGGDPSSRKKEHP